MLYKIFIGLFIISFLLYLYSFFVSKFKYINFLNFEYIKSTKLFGIYMELIKLKTKKMNKKLLMIKSSLLNINIEDFYVIKVLVTIFMLVFLILFYATNITIKKFEIISKPPSEMTILDTNGSIVQLYDKNLDIKLIYKKVNKEFRRKFNSLPHENLIIEISEFLKFNNLATDKNSIYLAEDIYNKMQMTSKVFGLKDIIKILLIIILTYFSPDIFLVSYKSIKNKKIEMEISTLESIILTVGGHPSITTNDIIELLVKSSKHIKLCLIEFQKEYTINKQDAYKKISVYHNKNIINFIDNIRQMETATKDIVLLNLKDKKKSRLEFKKMQNEIKVKRKDTIAVLLFLFLVVATVAMLASPFLNIIKDSLDSLNI